MSNKVAVHFLKAWRAFFANDVAAFEPADAEQLVEQGVAEYAAAAAPTTGRASRPGGKSGNSNKSGKGAAASAAPAAGAGADAPPVDTGDTNQNDDSAVAGGDGDDNDDDDTGKP